MPIHILAIESSCDDTSASVISDGKIVSNVVANQKIHSQYGGVVPEVASRKHQINIIPTVSEALRQAGIEKKDLNAIAVTKGPGLMGSLLVGVTFAKTLSLALHIPLIEINHMHAHVMALLIEEPRPNFPFLCLTVSGGHTQIAIIHSEFNMEVIGKTIDDAAGEAFDKTGKLLDLPYPAGPAIDRLAGSGKPVFNFPKPVIKGLDFSFSGLKTSILYFLQKQLKEDPDFIKNNLENICSSVQTRIVDILIHKLVKAARQTGIREIGIAGGVSANSGLRKAIKETGIKHQWNTYIPKFDYCTDNAAMIARTALFKYERGFFADLEITPEPRMKI